MTLPDRPKAKCTLCQDWTTVQLQYGDGEFVPCPQCQPAKSPAARPVVLSVIRRKTSHRLA